MCINSINLYIFLYYNIFYSITYMRKKILITGANGFIASQVVKLLSKDKYKIYGLNRRKITNAGVKYFNIDLSNHSKINNLISTIKPDYLIHTAWYNKHNEYWNSTKNIHSLNDSINIYDSFCKNKGKKILILGTCDEYAAAKKKCHEFKSEIKPANIYSSSKNLLHMYVQSSYLHNKVKYNWLRIFYPVGQGENKNRLLPSLIRGIKVNGKAEIKQGNYVKDLIHVEDCARAVIECLKSDYNGPINIGSGKGINISSIGKLIINKLGYGKLIIKNNKKSINDKKNYMVADNTILTKKIGFKFKYDNRKTINECCKYWDEN